MKRLALGHRVSIDQAGSLFVNERGVVVIFVVVVNRGPMLTAKSARTLGRLCEFRFGFSLVMGGETIARR